MATTKKTTGLLTKMKDAVTGVFSSKPARKSPKRVAAGKKAATTAKVNKAVATTEKAVKKAVNKVAKAVGAPAKKRPARKSS
jgi:hypothetical protein